MLFCHRNAKLCELRQMPKRDRWQVIGHSIAIDTDLHFLMNLIVRFESVDLRLHWHRGKLRAYISWATEISINPSRPKCALMAKNQQ